MIRLTASATFSSAAPVDDDLGALACESARDGKADASGRSRDESPLPAKLQIHDCRLPVRPLAVSGEPREAGFQIRYQILDVLLAGVEAKEQGPGVPPVALR